MTVHDDTHLWPPEALESLHSWTAERKRLESENERLRAAIETIAHDHAQHAYLFSEVNNKPATDPVAAIIRGAMSVTLGWAQGIAREALGEPQNEYTRHFSAVRDAAWSWPAPSAGSEGKTNG